MNQHAVVITFLQPWFDLRVKVSEESGNVTLSLDLKSTPNTISVSVQVTALVVECLVAVCRIELVLFLNDHTVFLLN